MSTQAPQVLSRRANGTPSGQAGHAKEPAKGRDSHERSTRSRSGRGRGSGEKTGASSKNPNEHDAPKPAKARAHHEGEKLVIRRLPPGMTETEFLSILGSEWEVGKGRVDWFSYGCGKVSNDPSKPSRPGRAYLHVTKKEHIPPLGEVVRASKWEDALATFNSPSLIGPVVLDVATYKKVPSNKKRTDARQGTIDQDPEFMAFLEELANPVAPKETTEDDAEDTKTETKVTTTPLIEYLKEKKANKAKDAAAAKSAKHSRQDAQNRQESGPLKGKGSGEDDAPRKKGRGFKTEKSERSEKPAKESVKILTKKAATEQAAEAAKAAAAKIAAASTPQEPPKSRRAGIAAAARLLQRDLGLSPGSAHRKARQDAAKAEADSKATSGRDKENTATTTERPASPAPSADAAPSSSKNQPTAPPAAKAQPSGRRMRGGKEKNKATPAAASATTPAQEGNAPAPSPAKPPVVLLKKRNTGTGDSEAAAAAPPAPSSAPQPTKENSGSKAPSGGGKGKSGGSSKKPTVTPDATRGFVKHANPSQGVTEALLKQALEVYGTITFVEIDKRKGFAYVDFAEHEGLVRAVSASPVPVAQGTVQVLERKDKKPANAAPASGASGSGAPEKAAGRGKRGRGAGNKSNAAASSTAAAAPSASTNDG